MKDFKMITELPNEFVKDVQFILRQEGRPKQSHKGQCRLPTGNKTEHVLVRKNPTVPEDGHKGQYHLPTGHGSREVALVTLNEESEGAKLTVTPREGSDMNLYIKDGPPQGWTDLNCYYDALHFVLLFPYGTPTGWTWTMKLSNGKNLSPSMFYRFMLQYRDETKFFNNILRSRRPDLCQTNIRVSQCAKSMKNYSLSPDSRFLCQIHYKKANKSSFQAN